MAKADDTKMVKEQMTDAEWEAAAKKHAKTQKRLSAVKEEHKIQRRAMREKENDLQSDLEILAQQVDTKTKEVPAQRDFIDEDKKA